MKSYGWVLISYNSLEEEIRAYTDGKTSEDMGEDNHPHASEDTHPAGTLSLDFQPLEL